jgi:hypothetical protein
MQALLAKKVASLYDRKCAAFITLLLLFTLTPQESSDLIYQIKLYES